MSELRDVSRDAQSDMQERCAHVAREAGVAPDVIRAMRALPVIHREEATPPVDAAAQEQIERLTAENERLREALKTIVADNRIELDHGGYVEFSKSEEECREIAYSALHPTPGGK
jgi:DNA-binding transcriptional MerR regulator